MKRQAATITCLSGAIPAGADRQSDQWGLSSFSVSSFHGCADCQQYAQADKMSVERCLPCPLSSGSRIRLQPQSMNLVLRLSLWVFAVCNCGSQPFSPVCGDGLTWSTACDARCNSHPCYTQGVCQYNPSGGSVAASGNACSGGALPSPSSAPQLLTAKTHMSVVQLCKH